MTIVRAPLALLVAALLWLLAAPMSAGTQDAAAEECFAQTGYCVQGRFLDYWENNGGLALNGYPLTGEFVATLEDSQPYTVQYFERARLEYHPENQAPSLTLARAPRYAAFSSNTRELADKPTR